MRIFKKLIRKIYHLFWFLSLFLFFVPCVKAKVMINGAEFSQSSFVAFADNTNGQLSRIYTTFVDTGSYYRSTSSILTTGGNTYGANWLFYSDIPFVEGHTYAISVLIGMANTYAITNSTSSSRLCIAENLTNAISRYNNYTFPCTSAWATSTNGVSSFTDGTVAYDYTLLSYIFTAEFTSNAVTGSYNSAVSNESNHIFGGYIVEELSSQPLSQSQITSAIQSSGLATASSVSQVQQSINQIQSDISSSANNIIDNQQQNTEDIINNQNENTNKEIDSQRVCKIIDKNSIIYPDKSLTSSDGSIINSNIPLGVTDYFRISSTSQLTLLHKNTERQSIACFYNINKTFISCINQRDLSEGLITIPNNSSYFRATIYSPSNLPSWELCSNGNQAIDDSLNNINGTLNDSSIDSPNDTLSSLNSNLPTNSVISDLLLLPVRLLQAIVNAIGNTCSTFNLGSLYGTNLIMPCIDIPRYLGNSIWTFIDLVFSGMFILVIRKKFIQIWENLTNLKGGANEVD